MYVYAYAFKSKVHYGSALGPGASVLPYYSAPLACVPAIIEGLTVCRIVNRKPKTSSPLVTRKIYKITF